MSTSKLIWILAGNRRGDNNQMLALAEALGLPFEIKILAYNPLHHLPDRKSTRLNSSHSH